MAVQEYSHVSRLTASFSECPFCAAIYQHGPPAYFKRVAALLREVSLSVLPQPADEDDEINSDDSEALSPASSRFQPEQPNIDPGSFSKSGGLPATDVEGGNPQKLQDLSHSDICATLLGLDL